MENYEELIEIGVNGNGPLKLILKGYIENHQGIVEVVYATLDKNKALSEFKRVTKDNTSDSYFMVYSVPFDTDLTTLSHYPSIAISKEEFE